MQSKINRKFISLMLAASLAGSPFATFPMNVFAGTGKNGVIKAPEMEQQQQLEAAYEHILEAAFVPDNTLTVSFDDYYNSSFTAVYTYRADKVFSQTALSIDANNWFNQTQITSIDSSGDGQIDTIKIEFCTNPYKWQYECILTITLDIVNNQYTITKPSIGNKLYDNNSNFKFSINNRDITDMLTPAKTKF